MFRTMLDLQAACSLSLGLGDDSVEASSVLVMPMVSSKITGFRGNGVDQAKVFGVRGGHGWRRISVDDDCETSAMLPQSSMV